MAAADWSENGFEQASMIVSGPVRKEFGMQESDLLDQLPDGEAKADTGTDHVLLVSLGCFCGPKLSFKHMGRGSETLPFDWMRTRHDGLMHFLQEDFEGFFDFLTKKAVPGCNMTTFRTYYHSFWHDDPTDPGMRERYGRRIKRFNAIDAKSQPVLFVRCIPSTDELESVPDLLAELRRRHGRLACLLIIIDFQMTAKGAAVVEGHENLLIYYLSGDHHVDADGNPTPPYCVPVTCALEWVIGKPIQAMRFVDMAKIKACADETHWGYQGLGGLNAFEATIEGPEEEPLGHAASEALQALPRLRPSLSMAASAGARPVAQAGTIMTVSLGCCSLTEWTLRRMGCPGAEAPMPFDWAMVSHEGLVHFLKKGFDSPVRGGLGAGGQRPAERHGFLDFAARKKVPGSDLVVSRSHLHSFWHDDLAEPEVRDEYLASIERFEALGSCGRGLLFVRLAATSAELARADELLAAICKRFGDTACLLLIADFQRTQPGAYVVDDFEENLLVYFLDSAEKSAEEETGGAYQKAVEMALAWTRGDPLEAKSVPDLRTLHELADETSWGLMGLGGLNAFEGALKMSEGPDAEATPSAEDAWLEEVKTEAAKEAIAVVSLGSSSSTAAALGALGISYDAVAAPDLAKGAPAEGSLEGLGSLSKSDRSKLFVYACSTAEELSGLEGLSKALQDGFPGQTCLLVLVCGQAQPRLVSVEGHYDVLVQFVPQGSSFKEPIKQSLNWVVGKPMQASVVKDFASLQALATQ